MLKRFIQYRLVLALIAMTVAAGCSLIAPPGSTIPDTVPDFESATFSTPKTIDNPYLPHPAGATRTYEGGGEVVVIDVLDDNKEVMGIAVRVVRDRVFVDNVLVEDTHDWFAQDDAGNVWYMGEEVDNYNYDDNGQLIDITHEGAWEAGKDVAGLGVTALPGYVMPANPSPGDRHHSEYYKGEAEDEIEVLALNVLVTLSSGTNYTCLQTLDTTALDPEAREHKYYAEGLGLVAEEHVDGSERIELVSVEP